MRLLALTAFLPAACNTPGRRIEKNQQLFDTDPPDVQAAIRAGRVEKGFDTNQAYITFEGGRVATVESPQDRWLDDWH